MRRRQCIVGAREAALVVIWFHGGGEPEEGFGLVATAGFDRVATWRREVGGCKG
jgi:hypothetical protein